MSPRPEPARGEPAESVEGANIARHLSLMAAAQPATPALKVPRGRTASGAIDYLTLSFAELEAEVNAWCERLASAGIHPGDRTLVMVRQGLPLIASVFALFRLGAVPVIIDPGMGRKNFLACVARSKPRVLVGIPLALLTSHVFRPAFASAKEAIVAPGINRRFPGGASGSPPCPSRFSAAAAERESDPGSCRPAGGTRRTSSTR